MQFREIAVPAPITVVQDVRDFRHTTIFIRKQHYTQVESDKTKACRSELLAYPGVREVELTLDEMIMGGSGAALHVAHNIYGGKRPQYNAVERGHLSLGFSFSSTLAELAVAKHFNMLWTPKLNKFNTKDVGGFIQVRSTDKFRPEVMLLHPRDNDSDPTVAAVVIEPVVYLLGWCYAAAGKKPAYYKDAASRHAAFWVPNTILRPIPELIEIVRNREKNNVKPLLMAYAQIDADKKTASRN